MSLKNNTTSEEPRKAKLPADWQERQRAMYREYHRQQKKRNPDSVKRAAKKSQAKWRKANPEKESAYNAVNYAVRTGKLRKEPCLCCGDPKVHAHHSDYSKKLDVIWLCAMCHKRQHERAA